MRRGVTAVIIEHGRMLAIRRSQLVTAPGAICFPGGGIEIDEAEIDALCRELQEELSASIRPIRRVWESVTPWSVHLAWWLAERIEPAALIPHLPEVAEYFWLTVDEMIKHPDLLASNRTFLNGVAAGEIDLRYSNDAN
jgi:8-oxo-dGTP pyrophosphatase MutT (NUDIX family)